MKYLGIDWGEKRIGLAISEEDVSLALPYCTVNNLAEILEIIQAEEIGTIVLGAPYKMGGKEELDLRWQKFKNDLELKTNLPIVVVDERLSSKEADSLKGLGKRQYARDEIAAALVLQNYLEGR